MSTSQCAAFASGKTKRTREETSAAGAPAAAAMSADPPKEAVLMNSIASLEARSGGAGKEYDEPDK